MSYKTFILDLYNKFISDASNAAPVQSGDAIQRLAWLTDDDRAFNKVLTPALYSVHDEDITISADETRSGVIVANNFTIDNGVTLTTGPLLLLASGTVTVNGTLTADGRGYSGGSEETSGLGGAGAGTTDTAVRRWHGGSADATTFRSSGIAYGLAAQLMRSSFLLGASDQIAGGGGGGGGRAHGSTPGISISSGGVGGGVTAGTPGRGGNGGGVIVVLCDDFNNNGTVSARGLGAVGAGGGGGGGIVAVLCSTLTRRGTVAVNGGAGGTLGSGGDAGGNGIDLFYHVATGQAL